MPVIQSAECWGEGCGIWTEMGLRETNLAGNNGCCCMGRSCDHAADDAKQTTGDDSVFAAEDIGETGYGRGNDSDTDR